MKKHYIYATISILLWSTTATVSKLLLGNLDSMQVLLLTSLFATIFLFIINAFKGNLKELRGLNLADYVKIAATGLLGTFLYNLFFYLGVSKMQASQAFIINYLWPIMTVFFACLILKEKITPRKIVAIIMSFVGVIVVSSNGNLLTVKNDTLLGAICCVLAAVSYGLFSVLNKKQERNTFVNMMLYYASSLIASFIIAATTKRFYSPELNQLLGLIWIGVFTSAIGFTSWVLAIEKGNTVKISNLAYVTPFLSLIWTSLILGESLSIYSAIGLALIILGILIQLKDHKD